MRRIFLLSVIASFIALASGCAVNPVTGERNLSLVGEQWELDVGAQQYAPLRQAQGGQALRWRRIRESRKQLGTHPRSPCNRRLRTRR